MPRIPDQYLNWAIHLYPSLEAAQAGRDMLRESTSGVRLFEGTEMPPRGSPVLLSATQRP